MRLSTAVIVVVLLSVVTAGVDGQNEEREVDTSICDHVLNTLFEFLDGKETEVRLLAAPAWGRGVVSLTACDAFSGLPGLREGQIL